MKIFRLSAITKQKLNLKQKIINEPKMSKVKNKTKKKQKFDKAVR